MATKVVVSNISPMLEESHLQELFACCGDITDSSMEGTGDSRKCTISFENAQHAKAALLLSGTPLGDRPLQVEEVTGNQKAAIPPPVNLNFPPPAPVPAVVPTENSAIDQGTSVSRTIYVGNLAPNVCEEHLRQFFMSIGNVLFIKMAGNPQQAVRYAFIEFDNPQSAQQALMLSGAAAMMGDRQLKIGPAMNPIVKPAAPPIRTDQKKIDEAMRRVREAQNKLRRKHGSQAGPTRRSRSRSRSPIRRSNSRERSSRYSSRPTRRSRSPYSSRSSRRRSRSPYRGSRYDRGRDREERRGGGGGGRFRRQKKQDPHEGLVWDGFQWHRPVDVNADPTRMAAQAQKYFLKFGSVTSGSASSASDQP